MPASVSQRVDQAAERVIGILRARNLRIVFAESCTAGLIAATLGRTPGVSDHLCGSAVVYRDPTKTAWLDIPAPDLSDPSISAVSDRVAGAMAVGVLAKTPEADLAASVTGYLGPAAPPGMDGRAYVGVAVRQPAGAAELVCVREVHLAGDDDRIARQQAAAAIVLETVADYFDRP